MAIVQVLQLQYFFLYGVAGHLDTGGDLNLCHWSFFNIILQVEELACIPNERFISLGNTHTE